MLRLLRIALVATWLTCISAEQQSLTVHITTWNVNSQNPPENLNKLLGQKENEAPPDVVILGLQEVTMNPKQAILDYLFRGDWSKTLETVLTELDYTKVKSKSLVSVSLMIYVKKEHAKSLSEIDAFSIATGFGGFYGNKGAVIVNFRLLRQRFAIVNCHLPANDGQVEARIEHMNLIEEGRAKKTWTKPDYIFLMGDMNFRLNESSNWDAETISNMIRKDLVKDLLEHDELKQLMAGGEIFQGWSEAEITFKPTFKVLIGDGSYNLKRRPAWTDRILYKSDTGKEIINTGYDSVDGYLESDHKPVTGTFEIPIEV